MVRKGRSEKDLTKNSFKGHHIPLVGDQDSDVFNLTIKLSRTLKPGPGGTIMMTANRIPAI